MIYYGRVKDSQTGAGIPGATVILIGGGRSIATAFADSQGDFSITTFIQPDSINFSSVGYQSFSFPASEYQHTYELEKDYRVIDPVILPPYPVARKNNFIFPALALLALIMLAKKR